MKAFRFLFVTLLIIASVLFSVGCDEPKQIPATKEEAVLKLETAGYEITEAFLPDGAIYAITAYMKDDEGYAGLMAIWFESEDLAVEYYESWNDSRYQQKAVHGVLVYYGTERAVKDFEKA